MIEWKVEFETGIPSADYEHRKLVELVNELHEQAATAACPATAAASLAKIVSHFTAHFRVEEEVMRAADFAGFDEHRHDHEHLLAEIGEALYRLERGESMAPDLVERLELWLVRHFHTWDKPMYRFLDRVP